MMSIWTGWRKSRSVFPEPIWPTWPTKPRYWPAERTKTKYLHDRIGVMFGGRLAESIVYGEVSNGAENDLEEATRLARRMIGRWGMSERVDPTSFLESDRQVFLGQEMARGRGHSEAIAALIDEEVQKLLKDIESDARKLLEKHRNSLDALAEALVERETLESEQLRDIMGRSSN